MVRKGLSTIMSANFRGFQTPPLGVLPPSSAIVSNCLTLSSAFFILNSIGQQFCAFPDTHCQQLSAFIDHPSAADLICERPLSGWVLQWVLPIRAVRAEWAGFDPWLPVCAIREEERERGRAGVRKGIRILRQIHSYGIFIVNVTIDNLQRSIY